MPSNKVYKRTRNLFDPASKAPFKLSRSRLENFVNCPRCFYLDRRLGVEPPGMPAFTLNSAVDELLKKEFDIYREKQTPHPLMKSFAIDCVPWRHPKMGEWREVFKGIQHYHKPTNLIIHGAIDDIWINRKEELFIVDYKSTSTSATISLDTEYRQAYKRQMEIYQWLFRREGFKVSDAGYFVYCNADKAKESFDARLDFKLEIIPYKGNSDWVEQAIGAAHQALMGGAIPPPSKSCEYCQYRQLAHQEENPKSAKKITALAQGELFD